MSAINAGDRFRLPSGNVVEIASSKHDLVAPCERG